MHKRRFGLLAFGALALIVSGCSDASVSSPPVADARLQYMLDTALDEGVASQAQVDVLTQAVRDGSLDFKVYQEAINLTLDCLADAGIPTMGPIADESRGFTRLDYAYQAGSPPKSTVNEGSPAIGEQESERYDPSKQDPLTLTAERCRDANSKYIEVAFDEQPSSMEANDTFLESQRPAVLACAQEAGLALEVDLPIRDLLAQLIDYGEPGRHCLGGINAF